MIQPALAGVLIGLMALTSACGSTGTSDGPKRPGQTFGGRQVQHTLVAMVPVPGGAREASPSLVPLRTAAERRDFTATFGPAVAHNLTAAMAKARPAAGQTLMGGVASTGCDIPADVVVHDNGSALVASPSKPLPTNKECYAPESAIALVTVASAAVH